MFFVDVFVGCAFDVASSKFVSFFSFGSIPFVFVFDSVFLVAVFVAELLFVVCWCV